MSSPLPTEPSPRVVWTAVLLLCLGAAGIPAFAFYKGRRVVEDRLTEHVAIHSEARSLLTALEMAHTSEEEMEGILAVYGLPADDVEELRRYAYITPPIPAPFVGHVPRPGTFHNATINRFGFRDERPDYGALEPWQKRVFVTGGSTAFGSGAPSQAETIPGLLESRLNAERGRAMYEVVNTAYPAYATMQERLIVTQRICFLQPSRIIMVSGTNDVHWSLERRDTAWFWSNADQHFVTLADNAHRAGGFPKLRPHSILLKEKMTPEDVASNAATNVVLAATAARRVGAELVFALQPNIVTTEKALSPRERDIRARNDVDYWQACYEALRRELSAIDVEGYRFLDLSRAFGEAGADEELFLDSYHFGRRGNELLAEMLIEGLEWW